MRVAICMRGGVSKYSNHIITRGQQGMITTNESPYINVTAIYQSIDKHIIKPNPSYAFDFFLHGWNVDLESTLVDIYHPVSYRFEDNQLYHEECKNKTKNGSSIAGPSQCLSIKKSIELKEAYESAHHITYDKVIVYRYDVLLWKDMNLSLYQDDAIYCNRLLFGPLSDRGGDYHFVMSSHHASQFKNLYDWITSENPFRAHYSIKEFIASVDIPFKEDGITIHRDQEVLRFIHKTKLSQFEEFGISDRDMDLAPTHIHFTVSALPSLLAISLVWSIIFHPSDWYRWFFLYTILSCIIQWLLLYLMDIEYTIALYILLLYVIEISIVNNI